MHQSTYEPCIPKPSDCFVVYRIPRAIMERTPQFRIHHGVSHEAAFSICRLDYTELWSDNALY